MTLPSFRRPGACQLRARLQIGLACVCLGLQLGCGEIKDAIMLSQNIHEQFHHNASVDLDGHDLAVVFDVASDTLPSVMNRQLADSVAAFVRDHYKEYGTLNKVTVRYRHKESGAVQVTRDLASFSYTKAELGAPAPIR